MNDPDEPRENAEGKDAELSRTERYLTELATAHSSDYFLLQLVARAQDGLPSPIAVLTNGMIIFGALVRSRDMAERMDADREKFLRGVGKPENISDEKWAQFLEIEREKFADGWDESYKAEQQFFKDLPEDGPLSAEQEEELIIYQRRPFLTITQARILAPGQAGVTRVPMMRVPMAAINGWWVPEAQWHEDGSYSFSMSFWEDPDDSPPLE